MMSYGPGYILWKEILREREERRVARLEAKRQAARAEPAAAGASQPAAARAGDRYAARGWNQTTAGWASGRRSSDRRRRRRPPAGSSPASKARIPLGAVLAHPSGVQSAAMQRPDSPPNMHRHDRPSAGGSRPANRAPRTTRMPHRFSDGFAVNQGMEANLHDGPTPRGIWAWKRPCPVIWQDPLRASSSAVASCATFARSPSVDRSPWTSRHV